MYKFAVDDVGKIDLNYIIRSNPGAEVILVTSGEPRHLVLVSPEFLARFKKGDHVSLNGYYLCSNWGFRRVSMRYDSRAVIFDNGNYDRCATTLETGWRGTTVSNMNKFVADLKTARAFQRAITVKVHVL